MALITCPHCGKQISDKSSVCVHCGGRIGAEMGGMGHNVCGKISERFY